MAYFGLNSSLRASVGTGEYVADPNRQKMLQLSPLVMDVLRLASGGDVEVFDLPGRLAGKRDIDVGTAQVVALEALRQLQDAGLVTLSTSPIRPKKIFESSLDVVGRALIALTYRCNFRCIHCLQGSKEFVPPPEMTTREWFKALKEMSDLGITFLFVTGGEPLLRKDAIDVMREASEYAFSTRLYTNGILFNDELANRLSKMENPWVQISLHGIDPASCDSFVGIPGAFNRILRAIRMLVDHGVRVSVATAFRDDLISRMPEFPRVLSEMGVREWIPTLIMPMGCAFDNWRGLRASNDTIRSFVENLLRLASIYKGTDLDVYSPFSIRVLQGSRAVWEHPPALTFSCDLYGQYINVDPEGNVHPCDRLTTLTLGNLRNESLQEVLSKKDMIVRQKLENFEKLRRLGIWDRCMRCSYRNLCGQGCPAILLQGLSLGEEEFDPVVCRIFQNAFDIILKYSTAPTTQVMTAAVAETADVEGRN